MKNIKSKPRLRKGFTLVELVVVIAIIAILASVSVAGYFGYTDRANKSNTLALNQQIKSLYTTYVSENSAKNDSSEDVIDQAAEFLDYCEENGIDKSKLNISYIDGVVTNDQQKSQKKAANDSVLEGALFLLIKGSGNYYSVMSMLTKDYTLTTQYYMKDVTQKGLQKVTNTALGSYLASGNKDVSIETAWEFPIDSSGVSNTDAEKFSIKAVKDGSVYKTVNLRYGKTLTSAIIDQFNVGKSSVYVSSTSFTGSYLNNEDGLYYMNASSIWKTADGKPFTDLIGTTLQKTNSNIIDNVLNLSFEISDGGVPFEPVAQKMRAVKASVRVYDDSAVKNETIYDPAKWTDEVIASDDDKVNYYFADADSAFTSLTSYTLVSEKRINKLSTKEDCGSTTIVAQKEADENVSVQTTVIKDNLDIVKSSVITKDATIEQGSIVNILHEGKAVGTDPYTFSGNHSATNLLDYSEHGSVLLTVKKGVRINLNGTLNITATIKNSSGGAQNSGVLESYETFAEVELESGSTIEMNDIDSILRVYGRVTGEGQIQAYKGQIVDKLALYDWKGGSNLYACFTSKTGGFPFHKYNLPDIAAPLKIYSQAIYTLNMSIYGGGSNNLAPINLIGSDGLFSIDSGYIEKTLDISTTKTALSVVGDIHTNLLNIEVMGYGFTGEKFFFPLYNLDITVEENSSATLSNQNFELMPGSSVTVKKGAVLNLGSSLIIYESFDYFKSSGKFSAIDSFDNAAPALFTNNGTINILSNIALGGKIYNNGIVNLDETDTTILKQVTPVVIIDYEGSNTSSKPLYAESKEILLDIIAGE